MKTLVLIPTYNEKDNLPILVTDLMAIAGVSVMVLDDQSPDGTGKVADELGLKFPGRVQVLHREGQRGLGVSYLEGFHRAIDTDYDFVCQMDADLSHDPKYLPAMIETAARGADLVIGSRYLNGISVVNWPLRRIILSQFANFYIRTVTGLHLRDITTGYRCWRRTSLATLPLATNGWSRTRMPIASRPARELRLVHTGWPASSPSFARNHAPAHCEPISWRVGSSLSRDMIARSSTM